MEDNLKTMVLVSGGIDSLLASHKFPGAELMFVDYGQPEAANESRACTVLFGLERVQRARVSRVAAHGVYYPARNLMLATLAAQRAGQGCRVVMGGMADDNCQDKTPSAFAQMSAILTDQCGYEVRVESPFWNTSKHDAVGDYLADFDHDDDEGELSLLDTFSCYRPAGEDACGECEACFRKSVALLSNGVQAKKPGDLMFEVYLQKLHRYTKTRSNSILAAARICGGVAFVDMDTQVLRQPVPRVVGEWALDPGFALVRRRSRWIVLCTRLHERHREEIVEWLCGQGVRYHALLTGQLALHASGCCAK